MQRAVDDIRAVKTNFPPVIDAHTRLLILGSLPGNASLKAAQYYAHPQNAFWRLTGAVIGRDLAALPYVDRLEALKAARIGLWDVIAGAERQGSLDGAIKNAEAADLRRLIAGLPGLRAVAFNGKTAARIGRRSLAGVDVVMIDLPSSSPAFTKPFAEKAEAWGVLKAFV
jgi:hypoxanthine-DNA glycosylase